RWREKEHRGQERGEERPVRHRGRLRLVGPAEGGAGGAGAHGTILPARTGPRLRRPEEIGPVGEPVWPLRPQRSAPRAREGPGARSPADRWVRDAQESPLMISRMRSAVSVGGLPTLTPAASRASFLAWAVPAEPDTMGIGRASRRGWVNGW